jgi:hypothetical protein
MSFEAFCPTWQQTEVALYQRCNQVPEAALSLDVCDRDAASLASGRQSFDRSVATGCLRQWQDASCAQFRALDFSICSGLFRGAVGEGGACIDDADCVNNLFCDRASPFVCPGVCRRPVPKDGDCAAQPSGCIAGYSCINTSDGPRCRPRAGTGKPCGPAIADCGSSTICAPSGTGEAQTCRPLLYPGETCTAGASSVCVAYASCAAGACKLNPLPGEPCGQIGESYVRCIKGWCDGAVGGPPGVCRAQLPLGAPCIDDLDCAGGSALCVQNICAEAMCPPP